MKKNNMLPTLLIFALLVGIVSPLNAQSQKQPYSLQPVVTGGISISQPNSFRLQAGVVKKWGFYVAWKTNFRFEHPGEGVELVHYENLYTWKDKPFYTRWAVYAGPMVRLSSRWIMHFGVGYGKIFKVRETTSGQRFYDDEMFQSPLRNSVEIDWGMMFRIKSFVLSAGFTLPAMIIMFPWTPAANISLGYIFPASKK